MSSSTPRVLVGSPIHQKPAVLREFLSSLLRLNKAGCHVDMFFIDDNDLEEPSTLLGHFANCTQGVIIESSGHKDAYQRDEQTHYWSSYLIWKVAGMKNRILSYAKEHEYDYVFLIDSDLVLHPRTLEQLIASGKEIISEIFWTRWQPESLPQPQVWISDEYNQWEAAPGEVLSDEEKQRRFEQFLNKMRTPGVYPVGGLGACTLISRKAIAAGVSFEPLYNLSFWGEDRHFCMRAAALGYQLYVDTHFPAFHIYRDSDLTLVKEYTMETLPDLKELAALDAENACNTGPPAVKRPKLTLSMVVRNEENRFLKEALLSHRQYIDEAVIIDDGSTDGTAALCAEILQGIPYRIIHNQQSKFSNEIELRKQQWDEIVRSDPEWILVLDADELFEHRLAECIDQLLRVEEVDLYCFRLFDFWDDAHYREDQYWHSHLSYRPFLLRYKPDFLYEWTNTPQHCGRLPSNVFDLPHQLSDIRLKHLGWSRPEYRAEKYKRYLSLDPDGLYGWKEQYDSILDENPNLVRWQE